MTIDFKGDIATYIIRGGFPTHSIEGSPQKFCDYYSLANQYSTTIAFDQFYVDFSIYLFMRSQASRSFDE